MLGLRFSLLALAAILPLPAMGGRLFWTDATSGKRAIRSMNLDASDATLATPLYSLANSVDPRGIALDIRYGYLYFTDQTRLLQAQMGGGGTASPVIVSASGALGRDIRILGESRTILWCDQGLGRVHQANLNDFAADPPPVWPIAAPQAHFLEVVPSRDWLFWGDLTTSIWITSLSQGGTSIFLKTSASTTDGGLSEVRGVAYDETEGYLYWSEKAGTIKRARYTGDGPTPGDLAGPVETVYSGLNAPHGIVLDRTARKIYWGDSPSNTQTTDGIGRNGINRGDMDGSGPVETLIGLKVADPLHPERTFSTKAFDVDLDRRTASYTEWKWRCFRLDADAAATDPAADPDNDGRANWEEYALGGNPLRVDRPMPLTARRTLIDGAAYFECDYLRRTMALDVLYSPQLSLDGINWRDEMSGDGLPPFLEMAIVSAGEEGDMERVTVRTLQSTAGAEMAICRLRVFKP